MLVEDLRTKEIRDNGLWWYGPRWLLSPSDSWPTCKLKSMDHDNFDNDSLMQIKSEMLAKTLMYKAKLVAGEGAKQQRDVARKRNTPLSICIYRFFFLLQSYLG